MTTRVIITKRLRTTKTLEQRIRRQHHILDLLNTTVLSSRDRGHILHDTFRCLRLASTRLS